MRLTNNYPLMIFWRMFNKGDTVYWFGFKEGQCVPGGTLDLYHPHGSFQLEIKAVDFGGTTLVQPGRVFGNDERWSIDDGGNLVPAQSELIELTEDSAVSIPFGRAYHFIDQINSDNDVVRTVTTTVSNVSERSAGIAQENQITQSATFKFGVSGGWGKEGGPHVEGNIGGEIGESISSKLNSTYTEGFTQSVANTITTSIDCKAGKLTAIVFEWIRHLVKGRVTVGGQTYPFVATTGFSLANTQVSTWPSIAAMPAELANAFASNLELATVWSVSGAASPGGRVPQRFTGSGWTAVDGGLVEIDAASDGSVWGVNDAQGIFRRENGGWAQIAGAAFDVSASRNGQAWVIGTDQQAGGYGIYRYTGSGFVKIPGGALRIGLSEEGVPWVVNTQGEVFRRNGANWEALGGPAQDIAVGNGDDAWIIGTTGTAGGFEIFRRQNGVWRKMPGGAVRIGMDALNNPWVVNDQNAIFRWAGMDWQGVAGEATAI